MEKPSSLDLLCMPPVITITPNQRHQQQQQHHTDTTTTISDSSDADLNHHGIGSSSYSSGQRYGGVNSGNAMNTSAGGHGGHGGHGGRQLHLLKVPTLGMTYLSPFSMCTRGDRVISEGNLSSSGYSSMASPGPSRCGSNNPLLPGEQGGGGSGGSGVCGDSAPGIDGIGIIAEELTAANSSTTTTSGNLRYGIQHPPTVDDDAAAGNLSGGKQLRQQQMLSRRARLRSDSFSDEQLLESNDEGIEMDHGNGSAENAGEETPEPTDKNVATVATIMTPTTTGSANASQHVQPPVVLDNAEMDVQMIPAKSTLAPLRAHGAMEPDKSFQDTGETFICGWSNKQSLPTITLQQCDADGQPSGAVAVSPPSSRPQSPTK